MVLIEEEYVELHRKGTFWINYCITAFGLIFYGGACILGFIYIITIWNMIEHHISELLFVSVFWFFNIYLIRDIHLKTPYHAYDIILLSPRGIDFINAEFGRNLKIIYSTDVKTYKIKAVRGSDYAYFYIDLVLHTGQKERVNLSFYMKPSEYERYKFRIDQIIKNYTQNYIPEN